MGLSSVLFKIHVHVFISNLEGKFVPKIYGTILELNMYVNLNKMRMTKNSVAGILPPVISTNRIW